MVTPPALMDSQMLQMGALELDGREEVEGGM